MKLLLWPKFSASETGGRGLGDRAAADCAGLSICGWDGEVLVDCADGVTVETVWMPEGDGGETGDGSEGERGERRSRSATRTPGHDLCLQPGGLRGQLPVLPDGEAGLAAQPEAGEIAGQVVAVFDRHGVEVGRDRVNLVFMGMGEPFLNYDNFMAAVRLLVRGGRPEPAADDGLDLGHRSGDRALCRWSRPEVRPKLAISLNAPNDAVRSEIMPINRKWPIEAVMDAVRKVQLRPRERITFEYVLLGGVTDRPEHAAEVARLVRRTGLPAKVNLIAWNPGPGIDYAMPQPEAVEAFPRGRWLEQGIPAYVRKPRGRDIYAACGQLKRTVEG